MIKIRNEYACFLSHPLRYGLAQTWQIPKKYYSQIGSTNCSGTQQPACYIATVIKRWHRVVDIGRHISVSLEQLLTVPLNFRAANLFTNSFFATTAILWYQASRRLYLRWTCKRMTMTDWYRVRFKIVFKEIVYWIWRNCKKML